MPITPPKTDSTTASIRNCAKTCPPLAPTASRMPISRVRSVTDTSMMFMIPMPPTNRLTAATADNSPAITELTPLRSVLKSRISVTEKLSPSPISI